MALPNRQVRGYTAQQGLRPTGATLISGGAGRLAGPPGMRAQTVGAGQRLTPATMTAARESEGVSQGLTQAGAAISQSILKYVDDKNRLEAVEKQAQLSEELSRLWLGYTKQELQADGTYKDVFVPGFSSLENREAVDGYGSYEEAVRAKFDEVADSMNPAVQQHFMASAVNTLTGYLNNGRQHAAASLRTWSNEALNMEVSRVSSEINNFLVTGDADKVLPYLVDQFSMIGNKYPMSPAKAEKFKNSALMEVATFLSTQDNASNKIKLFRDSLKSEVSLETYVGMTALHQRAIDKENREARQARADAELSHNQLVRKTTSQLFIDIVDGNGPTHDKLKTMLRSGVIERTSYVAAGKMMGYEGPGLTSNTGGDRLDPQDLYAIEQDIITGNITDPADIVDLAPNTTDQRHLFTIKRQAVQNDLKNAMATLNQDLNYIAQRTAFNVTASLPSIRIAAWERYKEELAKNPNARPSSQLIARETIADYVGAETLKTVPPEPIMVDFKVTDMSGTGFNWISVRNNKATFNPTTPDMYINFVKNLLKAAGVQRPSQLPNARLVEQLAMWASYHGLAEAQTDPMVAEPRENNTEQTQ